MVIKGDLIKRGENWALIYSNENSGQIKEYTLKSHIVKKFSDFLEKAKFFSDVSIDLKEDNIIFPEFKIVNNHLKSKETKKNNLDDSGIDFSQVKDGDSESKLGFTKEELKVMKLLTKTHNKFVDLKTIHPSHLPEWVFHIHSLQRILGQRILYREHSEIFPPYYSEDDN